MRVSYPKIPKADTFLHQYMHHMNAVETAHAYDFWTGIWLIGNAIGRNCIIDRPRAPVYMNWYVLIIAESGVTRKSTAVKHAGKIARMFAALIDDHIDFVEVKIVPEYLEHRMHTASLEHGYANVSICVSELVRILGKEKYTRTMPGLLTDLYDAPALQTGGGTLSRGELSFRNVFVNLLSASTPSWLLTAINPDVIEGGFTSRTAFIVCERSKRRISWPDAVEGGDILGGFAAQLADFRRRSRELGRIAVHDDALSTFKRWYNRRTHSNDPFRASYESREDSHVLRLAGCLAVNDAGWLIRKSHIKAAIRVIEEVKEDGAQIFEGGLSGDKLVIGIDQMRSSLLAAGRNGLAQAVLYKQVRNYITNADFLSALRIMHELRMVEKFDIRLGMPGRPKVIWKPTDYINANGAVDMIAKGVTK